MVCYLAPGADVEEFDFEGDGEGVGGEEEGDAHFDRALQAGEGSERGGNQRFQDFEDRIPENEGEGRDDPEGQGDGKAIEMTFMTLATIHNLYFMVDLMKNYRQRILRDEI